jgi:hypothetical protein
LLLCFAKYFAGAQKLFVIHSWNSSRFKPIKISGNVPQCGIGYQPIILIKTKKPDAPCPQGFRGIGQAFYGIEPALMIKLAYQ